ncbi:MAG: hypothetical protein WBG08_08790, partial [Litorimonas sp.]
GNRTEGAIIGGIVGGIAGTALGGHGTRSRSYSQPTYYSAPRRTYTQPSYYGGTTYNVGHSSHSNCPAGTRSSRDPYTGSTVCVIR